MDIATPPQIHKSLTGVGTRQRHVLPAVLMRAGTSKGLFIQRQHLPASQADWAPAILAAMGSADADPRQVDGLGGATSTTSKVAVVGPSSVPGADVDYTFVQVGVGSSSVDLSGSCGNMASGVGPFAVEGGMVKMGTPPGKAGSVDVRVFNTNTQRLYVETVEVDAEGRVIENGDYSIPGVSTPGSEIKIGFVEPAGSMTGRLFPSGSRVDVLRVPLSRTAAGFGGHAKPLEEGGQADLWPVRTTLIDAANPFVVIDATSLPPELRIGMSFISPVPGTSSTPILNDTDLAPYLAAVEAIRRAGAVRMGLASSAEKAALTKGTPKAAIVWPPAPCPIPDAIPNGEHPDIQVLAFSMGKPHPTLQLTGAVCLAAAVCAPGTVAWEAAAAVAGGADPDGLRNGLPPSPERTPSPASSEEGGGEKKKEVGLSSGVVDAAAATAAAASNKMVRRVRIAHRKGSIDVGCIVSVSPSANDGACGPDGNEGLRVERCTVSRTARRLFEGRAYYYS